MVFLNSDAPKAVICFNCQEAIELEQGTTISRQEECPKCGFNLRCCKMCRLYDPSLYNECREPQAERVVDKEKANFCDYFSLQGGNGESSKREDLLSKANALFKNK